MKKLITFIITMIVVMSSIAVIWRTLLSEGTGPSIPNHTSGKKIESPAPKPTKKREVLVTVYPGTKSTPIKIDGRKFSWKMYDPGDTILQIGLKGRKQAKSIHIPDGDVYDHSPFAEHIDEIVFSNPTRNYVQDYIVKFHD